MFTEHSKPPSASSVLDDDDLSFPNVPPFPDNVPTVPLVRLSLANLRNDGEESARLFSACKDLGFFYLDLRHDETGERLLGEADRLFKVGESLFELGRKELGKYDYKSLGSYMGYKGFGKAVADEGGNLDRNEFYNVSIEKHECCAGMGMLTKIGAERRLSRYFRDALRTPGAAT